MILTKLEFPRQIIKSIKFKDSPSKTSCSTLTDGRTDMKQQIDVFHKYVTAPTNGARFWGNDSGGIINRNAVLHTKLAWFANLSEHSVQYRSTAAITNKSNRRVLAEYRCYRLYARTVHTTALCTSYTLMCSVK